MRRGRRPTARPRRRRPRPDLDDHVLVVVRVALDHREPDLLLELLEARAGGREHLAQLGVLAVLGEELLGPGGVVRGAPPLLGQLGGGLERVVLAPDLGVALPVRDHLGVRHAPARSAKRASICSTSDSITQRAYRRRV